MTTPGLIVASAELYDPNTGMWTSASPMKSVRHSHAATRLASGKVLVTGGECRSVPRCLVSEAEVFDPASGTWTSGGNMAAARSWHSATSLPSGRVLVAGGLGNSGALASAEIYDPGPGTWTTTGSMATGRQVHEALLLRTGRAIVLGGSGDAGPLSSAELYDPITGVWTATGSMGATRTNPAATLLPDGRVLCVGGFVGTTIWASAEFYEPPPLPFRLFTGGLTKN